MGVEISVNWDAILQFFLNYSSQSPAIIAWQLFIGGGWVVLLVLVIFVFYLAWLDNRQGKFAGAWKHTLLAIDIPRNNEQTPKAVENVFIALAATQSGGNLIDQYWDGKVQESFSFEIISLEGYVQFLVRTPSHFRDLVEASIYAQYPEAQISEVNDYTQDYSKLSFPHEEYKLWGTEFVLVKDYPYPIKTYPDFEHSLSGEFLDPMAALLEIMSRFGPGEQLWLQLVVTPQEPGWGDKADEVVKKFKGESYTAPATWADKYITKPISILLLPITFVAQELLGIGAGEGGDAKEEDQWKMFRISPGERLVFEKVERKLSMHRFEVKFRMVYLGKKDVFSKPKGVAGIIGAIQQFNTSDSNGFKPGGLTKTGADYFMVDRRTAIRQNAILRQYVGRSNYYGEKVGQTFLNPEELASLWHFPVMTVKAPTVEMAGARRVVPPSRLPLTDPIINSESVSDKKQDMPASEIVQESQSPQVPEVPISESLSSANPEVKQEQSIKPTPPSNLPTV